MPDILASDINTIRQKVTDVLGAGATSFGYGQTLQSVPVSSGQLIEKSQWDAIRFDIVNCYIHQTGNTPSATVIGNQDVITDDVGDAYQNYNYYADIVRNNRFDVATGQYVITGIDTETTSSSWSTSAEATLTITFGTADQARYFFNSGGKIRIRTDFEPTPGAEQQSNAWQTALTSIGDRDFSGDLIAALGFYTLTDSYQAYYQTTVSTPYSANYYSLQAKSNVADNSAGTATEVTIKILLRDDYADLGAPPPGDSVTGTLTITANELRASGTLQPTGDPFSVTAPSSYVLSTITTT